MCDAGCAVGASVKVVQCGVRAGSAGVSCLVVSGGGAESNVAGGVHWCGVLLSDVQLSVLLLVVVVGGGVVCSFGSSFNIAVSGALVAGG